MYKEMTDWLDSVVARHEDAFVRKPSPPPHPLDGPDGHRAGPPTGDDHDGERPTGARERSTGGGSAVRLRHVRANPDFQHSRHRLRSDRRQRTPRTRYVDVESLYAFWEALLLFVMDWCGVEE